MTANTPLRLLLALLVTGSLASQVQAQAGSGSAPAAGVLLPQNFGSGQRWRLDSPAGQPWIPRSVAFAARGELVWSGPSIANPNLLLASTAGDSSTAVLFQDSSPVGAIGPVEVCAGDEPGELFSALQFPNGSARTSLVLRHDPRPSALTGDAFVATWNYSPGVLTDRPSMIECGPRADVLVVATYDGAAVQVDWIDPSDGARLARVSVAGTGLSALSLSESTDRVALLAGLDLWVIDRAGTTWHHEQVAAGTSALALSEDGSTLVYGDFGLVHLLRANAVGYLEVTGVAGQPTELPTQVALDESGASLAVGWWRFTTGVDVRLEVWDLVQATRLVLREQLGSTAGYQNFPEAVELSADGSRAAFGLWGLQDAQPELYLIDVPTDTDRLAFDLPGSVRALALDETGTRVALGLKDGHANEFGTTGSVTLLDTGERDLQLLTPPVRGGKLSVATSFPGQLYTVVLLGEESSAGSTVSGWSGLNWIDTSKPFLWRGAVPDGNGFSTRSLKLPNSPSLVGLVLTVQAIFVTGTAVHFSDELLHPVIL